MRITQSLIVLILLRAGIVAGQPVVGPEIASDPLPVRTTSFATASPSVAMARDHGGVAIAWMMAGADGADRIHVSRVDGSGRFSGPVREIPAFSPSSSGIDATTPSLASSPDGTGFVLAWLEAPFASYPLAPPARWRAVYCRLDAGLNPTPSALLIDAISTAAVVRSGKETWITAGGRLWQVQSDGTVSDPITPGPLASDMTIAAGLPTIVGNQTVTTGFTCAAQPGCQISSHGGLGNGCLNSCLIPINTYALQFVSLYTASGGPTFPFFSNASPAVQTDGNEVLAAWFWGPQDRGGYVQMARVSAQSAATVTQSLTASRIVGDFGSDFGPMRPDIAMDGRRDVIVWRSTTPAHDHDILGASIASDGTVTPLPIATSSADERDPSVIAMGNGSFLVAYEKISGGERRIAGRLVTFEERRRPAR